GPALGGDVVDILRRGDGGGNGRGYEALDELRACAGIRGGDGDDRLLHLRILPDGKIRHALQPEQQDHERQNRGENRPPDKGCGDVHLASAPICIGRTVLSMVTRAPLESRFCPASTTTSPADRPSTISTEPLARLPTFTKICSATNTSPFPASFCASAACAPSCPA